MPQLFDIYIRVFHHTKERVGDDWVRRRWSEVAARTGRRMHPAVQFDRFGWDERPSHGTLDRREADALVAVLRDHTETPDDCFLSIWNGWGLISGGAAPLVRARPLAGLLRRGRPKSAALSPPADLGSAPTVSLPSRDYYLYRGSIDVVPRFEFLPGHLQTPNLWWPEDRAWFVGSEIDFDSTLVACSRDCARALLAGDLETREVSPDTRLDIEGDIESPPA